MQKRNEILWRDFDPVRCMIGAKDVEFNRYNMVCPRCGSESFYTVVTETYGKEVLGSIEKDTFFVDIIKDGKIYHYEQVMSDFGVQCSQCRTKYTEQALEEANAKA